MKVMMMMLGRHPGIKMMNVTIKSFEFIYLLSKSYSTESDLWRRSQAAWKMLHLVEVVCNVFKDKLFSIHYRPRGGSRSALVRLLK